MPRTWAVIGTGRMAAQFGRAIVAAGDRVGCVVSSSIARAQEFAEQFGGSARAVGDVREVSDVGDVELAYVASPNDRHAQHIATLSALGLPVLCEKPLAVFAAEAREIAARADTDGATVGVAFHNRQHPAHRRARELVAGGFLGQLRMVDVAGCLPGLEVPDWYADPSVSGGGILPMSGVHRVDLVRHIVGADYASVSASVAFHRGAPYDDSATIAATFADGVGSSFVFGLDAPYGDDRVAFHGTNGTIVIEGTMSQWWSDAPGTLTTRGPDGANTEAFPGVDAYRLQVEDFARFAGGETSSIASLGDALAVTEFSEAVYRSAETGERIQL